PGDALATRVRGPSLADHAALYHRHDPGGDLREPQGHRGVPSGGTVRLLVDRIAWYVCSRADRVDPPRVLRGHPRRKHLVGCRPVECHVFDADAVAELR